MRIVTVNFSAAADGRTVVMEEDTVLSFVASPQATAVVSTDPAGTIANSVTAPGDMISKSVIAICRIAGSQVKTDFPLSAGERIFVSSQSAGSVQLFFTDFS